MKGLACCPPETAAEFDAASAQGRAAGRPDPAGRRGVASSAHGPLDAPAPARTIARLAAPAGPGFRLAAL